MRLLPHLLAVAALAATLPSAAEAQTAMCSEPPAAGNDASAAADAEASAIAAPARPPAPIVLRPVEAPRAERSAPLPFDDVPWCVSPDDPRCRPLPGKAPQTQTHREAPVPALGVRLPTPRGVDTAHGQSPARGLGPRVGHGQRLERPPRTDRR